MLYELARGIYCINDNSEIVWRIDLVTKPSIEAIMEESYSQYTSSMK